MRVLVTGSRDWTDRQAVFDALDKAYLEWLPRRLQLEVFYVVHGGARGADRFADEWARNGQVYTRPELHEAHWGLRGHVAGHERNTRMVKLGADLCLAFPLGRSPGTRDCIKKAKAAGIPVEIIRPESGWKAIAKAKMR